MKKPSRPFSNNQDQFIPKGFKAISDSLSNRGITFTAEERRALGLDGLLPPAVLSMETQVARSMMNFRKKTTDIEK